LSQKIRALRSLNRHREADELLQILRALDDRYGEFELMHAQQQHRAGNLTAAIAALTRAEMKPRSNKWNIRFIKCIWQIDDGNFSELDEAVSHAIAVGRADEANHLRSRAALKSGKIDDADRLSQEIKRPHQLDLHLRVKILDELLRLNPDAPDVKKAEWKSEMDKVLAATRRAGISG